MGMKPLRALLLLVASLAAAQVRSHHINVGQADATLLEFPKGAILIDAGAEPDNDDVLHDHLLDYLHQFFARRTDLANTLDAIIITHPHLDHTSMLLEVLHEFKVTTLVDNGGDRGSGFAAQKEARQYAHQHDIRLVLLDDEDVPAAGKRLRLGRLGVPGPDQPLIRALTGGRDCDDVNNDSIVIRVDYAGRRLLYAADSETRGETGCPGLIGYLLDLHKSSNRLKADLLRVGHHGSRYGTSAAWLTSVQPAISIISAGHHGRREGKWNSFCYGHPSRDAVQLLTQQTSGIRPAPIAAYSLDGPARITNIPALSKQVYCTCWDGDIVVEVSPTGDITTTTTPANRFEVDPATVGPPGCRPSRRRRNN